MLFESLERCLDRSRRLGQRRSSAMLEFHKAEAMQAFVDDAVKKGARVVNAGGGTACETLYFPAVVYPVRDPDKFVKLIDSLPNQLCRINLNAQWQRGPDTLPFTGRKDSAEATLSITDALRCFSIRSLVAAQSNPESRDVIQEIVTRRNSNFLRTDFIL
jgi:glyceraldehyde-3-phosphate dehydrogenase (NADP+)